MTPGRTHQAQHTQPCAPACPTTPPPHSQPLFSFPSFMHPPSPTYPPSHPPPSQVGRPTPRPPVAECIPSAVPFRPASRPLRGLDVFSSSSEAIFSEARATSRAHLAEHTRPYTPSRTHRAKNTWQYTGRDRGRGAGLGTGRGARDGTRDGTCTHRLLKIGLLKVNQIYLAGRPVWAADKGVGGGDLNFGVVLSAPRPVQVLSWPQKVASLHQSTMPFTIGPNGGSRGEF